jgi:hypothetical protein
MLSIKCTVHPKYQAKRVPRSSCNGCQLLWTLRYQHTKEANDKLGGLNPYQFFDAEQGAELLRAI